jgi:NAD(P)-dependent dehydrogenase (short-subunit alcohol dehydrogenase family)
MTYNDGRFPWMCPAYGASKAALNFLTTDYAKDLRPEGFIVVPLYPGVEHSCGRFNFSGSRLAQPLGRRCR